MNMLDAMDKRTSVRTYLDEMPGSSLMESVEKIVTKQRKGPFGNRFSFTLISVNDETREEIGKLSSYGMIKNAPLYFGGYAENEEHAIIDYGYCFEEAVLELAAIGLGTCWLGGTFSRGKVARLLTLPEGKIIPAISPIGFSGEKMSLTEKISRFVAGSKNRKPHNKILFSWNTDGQLMPEDLEKYPAPVDEVIESVRFAPSASNKQPWRIVRQGDLHHLYCDLDKNYARLFRHFKIQLLDMGIALCHFLKASEELRWRGKFSYADPHLENSDWIYILSWKKV
ncbi:nitroreductase family protein [Spirochaeta isovalerica]|uniref:Nitroreductase n=1 Tax=Spirochaeta isovalerica TaxID=150 RepID=A0A841RH04_9SPIO|nr:nitroreductase family protein [Spirochaeta isovalerica]MBB6482661.1 nitroreductase [Spirochaeta isovalerica]